jgi:hypothetical protein
VSVSIFVHFTPAGVAGVPNSLRVDITLIKKGRKKTRK